MKTNKEKLVIQSVCGSIHHPTMHGSGHWVGYDGYGRIPVGPGGITYNYQIGDSCMRIPGDHVEPGVSIKNMNDKENNALQTLSCIGNQAKIISGDAKGSIGFVTGTHGGVDHVMVYFDKETLEMLCIGDHIQIKSCGQGLKLLDHPQVFIMNLDPSLLERMHLKEQSGCLEVGVTHIIPAYLMGGGLGSTTMMSADYDIMTQDKETVAALGLHDLRFGDIVAIMDHDNHNGPHFHKGSVSIGIIVHSDSYTSGHGPGVTVLMTADQQYLKPYIEPEANLVNYMIK